VEKLCSTKFSQRAEGLLKNRSPLKPMEVPKKGMQSSVSSAKSEEDIASPQNEEQDEEQSESSEQQSRSSSPPVRPLNKDFKARLEEILVKPAATVRGASKSALITRPVPLPRKRVMFNTMDSGKSFNDSDDNYK